MTRPPPPKVANAPGLVWKPRKDGFEARWQCRTDIAAKGFEPKSARIWGGNSPSEIERQMIADACRRLQSEMLVWSKGGIPQVGGGFNGTLRSLINEYQTDKDSNYHKLRYGTRKNTDHLLRRLAADHGAESLSDIKARVLIAWHKVWSHEGKKPSMGHAFIARLRTLFSFGATILEDGDCERLSSVLSKMRFSSSGPRTERMTAEQCIAIRRYAHFIAYPSIALAQAIQFELMLRQKDCIGEWVPIAEPGVSDLTYRGKKWLHGLRWQEIDENMILRHVTSKRGKIIEVDLKLAPMVMEELELYPYRDTTGPIIICESSGMPYITSEFRRKWRIVAEGAGIPKEVRNMDSRAGGITEASDAGADMEHIRHAATHSNISMTQRYSRGSTEKVANVMQLRIKHRNRPETEND